MNQANTWTGKMGSVTAYIKYIKYGLIIIFIIIIYYLYSSNKTLKNQIDELTFQNKTLELTVEHNKLNYEKISNIKNEIIQEKEVLKEQLLQANEKLSKFDIVMKSYDKHPVLIQKIIDNSVKNYNRCLENISNNKKCNYFKN